MAPARPSRCRRPPHSPPGANQFTIGATAANTATNLQAALTSALSAISTQTALPAASAMAAANNFFSSDPPQRVSGPPYDTATSLVSGTAANTVFWYTGENGSTPARQTATAQVGPSTTIAYGMRANEQAISDAGRQCGRACRDDLFGERSECAGELSGAQPEVAANLDGQPGTQRSAISRPISPMRRRR